MEGTIESGASLHESERGFEPLSEEDFLKLLNGIGNHEGKLITTAIIASQPERWFSRSALYWEIMKVQGQKVGWNMSKLLPGNYCDLSLGPIGAVIIDDIEGKRGPVHSFKATEFGQTYGLAMAGSLLDWSLKYPDFSLQKILGATNSSTGVRAPEVRWKILSELVTSPEGEISFGDIYRSICVENYGLSNIGRHVHELDRAGVVELKSTRDEYNPIFSIKSPDYHHLTRGLDETFEATQAIYSTMKKLEHDGVKESPLADILETAGQLFPTVNPQEIYYKLVKAAASTSGALPGLIMTDRNGAPIKRNSAKLRPESNQAITELLERLERFREGEDIQEMRSQARYILTNPEEVSFLLAKARRFSHMSNAEQVETTNQRIVNIVQQLGSASASEIREALADAGREYEIGSLMRRLASLEKLGDLVTAKGLKEPNRRIKVKKFSLRVEDSADQWTKNG